MLPCEVLREVAQDHFSGCSEWVCFCILPEIAAITRPTGGLFDATPTLQYFLFQQVREAPRALRGITGHGRGYFGNPV